MKIPELMEAAEAAVLEDDFESFTRLEQAFRQIKLAVVAAHSELLTYFQNRGPELKPEERDLSEETLELYESLEEALRYVIELIGARDYDDLLEVVAEVQECSEQLESALRELKKLTEAEGEADSTGFVSIKM